LIVFQSHFFHFQNFWLNLYYFYSHPGNNKEETCFCSETKFCHHGQVRWQKFVIMSKYDDRILPLYLFMMTKFCLTAKTSFFFNTVRNSKSGSWKLHFCKLSNSSFGCNYLVVQYLNYFYKAMSTQECIDNWTFNRQRSCTFLLKTVQNILGLANAITLLFQCYKCLTDTRALSDFYTEYRMFFFHRLLCEKCFYFIKICFSYK
jgi:hypothetical protein